MNRNSSALIGRLEENPPAIGHSESDIMSWRHHAVAYFWLSFQSIDCRNRQVTRGYNHLYQCGLAGSKPDNQHLSMTSLQKPMRFSSVMLFCFTTLHFTSTITRYICGEAPSHAITSLRSFEKESFLIVVKFRKMRVVELDMLPHAMLFND